MACDDENGLCVFSGDDNAHSSGDSLADGDGTSINVVLVNEVDVVVFLHSIGVEKQECNTLFICCLEIADGFARSGKKECGGNEAGNDVYPLLTETSENCSVDIVGIVGIQNCSRSQN